MMHLSKVLRSPGARMAGLAALLRPVDAAEDGADGKKWTPTPSLAPHFVSPSQRPTPRALSFSPVFSLVDVESGPGVVSSPPLKKRNRGSYSLAGQVAAVQAQSSHAIQSTQVMTPEPGSAPLGVIQGQPIVREQKLGCAPLGVIQDQPVVRGQKPETDRAAGPVEHLQELERKAAAQGDYVAAAKVS